MMMESTSREAAKFLIHAEEPLNQNELTSECGQRIPTRNSFAPIRLPIRFWKSFWLGRGFVLMRGAGSFS